MLFVSRHTAGGKDSTGLEIPFTGEFRGMGFRDAIEELMLNGDYEGAKVELLKPTNENFVEQGGMNLMTRVFDIGLRTACSQEQILKKKPHTNS